MAEPRIAPSTPIACAGCYGQYPERVHVDFRSALEGAPVSDNPRAPRVEWVVICEKCIESAHRLLPEQVDAKANLEAQIVQLKQRCDEAENYASTLEDALQARPGADAPREAKRAPAAPKSSPQRRNRYDRSAA